MPFDGLVPRREDRSVAARETPRATRKSPANTRPVASEETSHTVAQQAGHQLRLLGHQLAIDAGARLDKREQTAGHIMRDLGALVGNGKFWTVEELTSPDPILAKLEQARRALAAAVKLEREKQDRLQQRRNDEIRAVHKMLGVSGPPPTIDLTDPNEPFKPLLVDEPLASIARRYLCVMGEWGDHAFASAADVASSVDICRLLMQDNRLLGLHGSRDEHLRDWANAIGPILQKGLRASSRAEEIVRACARQQGHPESVAKNLIRD